MLVMFDFAVVQLRYFKSAMDLIPTFRPDGKSPAMVQAVIDAAASVREQYVTTHNEITGARATRRTSIETLHDWCVAFSAQGASRYRKDKTMKERFDRLPVQDKTFQETMVRADAIVALWAGLPLVNKPSGPAGPFTFGMGTDDVTLPEFTAMRAAARAADQAIPGIDQDFQSAEGTVHLTLADMEDFASGAFVQGRSQFAEGTQPREIIEAVPETPSQSAPGKAVITSALVTTPGTVHLVYDAPSATTFDVLHRLAGAAIWLPLADNLIEKEFDATGLAAGVHEFAIIGHNSRGDGEQSDAASVTV